MGISSTLLNVKFTGLTLTLRRFCVRVKQPSRPSHNIHSHGEGRLQHHHRERIDEAESNGIGPSQEWDKEDEAEVSRHPQGGSVNKEDERRIQEASNVHSRHDRAEDVVVDCSNLQESFEATQRSRQKH